MDGRQTVLAPCNVLKVECFIIHVNIAIAGGVFCWSLCGCEKMLYWPSHEH